MTTGKEWVLARHAKVWLKDNTEGVCNFEGYVEELNDVYIHLNNSRGKGFLVPWTNVDHMQYTDADPKQGVK